MTGIDEVRSVVVQLVQGTPKGMLGTLLAQAIRARLPDFRPPDYGARNLKEFIHANVPEVASVGHAGADVLYGVTSQETDEPTGKRGQEGELSPWEAWATPSSGVVLDVTSDGSLSVVKPEAAKHSRLEPLSAERHRQIASDFITEHGDSLSRNDLTRLQSALDDTTDRWWGAWMMAARMRTATNVDWLRFRLQHLRESLSEDLQLLGLDLDAQHRALTAIIGARRTSAWRTNVGAVSRPPSPDAVDLRTVIRRAVDVLDEPELRRIALPVGVVFDILVGHDRR